MPPAAKLLSNFSLQYNIHRMITYQSILYVYIKNEKRDELRRREGSTFGVVLPELRSGNVMTFRPMFFFRLISEKDWRCIISARSLAEKD